LAGPIFSALSVILLEREGMSVGVDGGGGESEHELRVSRKKVIRES